MNTRTRLRQEIAALRALFPEENESAPLLHITPTRLQLNPSVVSDAIAFRRAMTGAKQASDPAAREQCLANACALYRADLLTEYDTLWIVREREQGRNPPTYLLVCTETAYGFFETKSLLYLLLDLPDAVRSKIRNLLPRTLGPPN